MSSGSDSINNEILSHIPPTGMEFLLSIYSLIWTESLVWDAWRKVTAVFVPKPGKDCSLASSYRPINFTCSMCKKWSSCYTVILSVSWELKPPIQCPLWILMSWIHLWPSGEPEILHTKYLFPMPAPSCCLFQPGGRHMTQLGSTVSSIPFSAGISGINYHCF
jgi:hypothetical protein